MLLIPALGGYWFLTHFNYTRYESLRSSGYHIFFRSLCVGFFLLFISELVLARVVWVENVLAILGPGFDDIYSAFLSAGLGFIMPYIFNLLCTERRMSLRDARQRGNLVELIFARSIDEQRLVEVSLRTNKSYIGLVIERKIGERDGSDVALLPFASGYRDKNTRELKITTRYSPVVERLLKSESDEAKNLRIVIPLSEIVSARLFDTELYEKQFNKEYDCNEESDCG